MDSLRIEESWYRFNKLCESEDLRNNIAENAFIEFNRQYDPLVWCQRLVDN